MGHEELFMYPGYGELPEERPDSVLNASHTVSHGPSATGATSHPFEKQIVVPRIEGESEKAYHDRRRQAGIEAGHQLFEQTHGRSEQGTDG